MDCRSHTKIYFFSLFFSSSAQAGSNSAELREGKGEKKNYFWHGNLVSSVVVVVVVVVSLAATHVSTSSAGTHEAAMGDSRSPFSDAQTN